MAIGLSRRLRFLWRRMSRVDVIALAVLIAFSLEWIANEVFPKSPHFALLTFLAFFGAVYFAIRGIAWGKKRLLWSLRNRLIVAYIFFAVVPVLLLLIMAGLAAYVMYWQLGAYVLYQDVNQRVARVANVATVLATALHNETLAAGHPVTSLDLPERTSAFLEAARADLPELSYQIGAGQNLLQRAGNARQNRFAGIVQDGTTLALRAVVSRALPDSTNRVVVSVSVPVTPELMDSLAPELGPIQIEVLRPAAADAQGPSVPINQQIFTRVASISTRQREVPPATSVFDRLIDGTTPLDVVDLKAANGSGAGTRVYAFFSTRPSLLNRRLFSALGDISNLAITALYIVGGVFLAIEFAAAITGFILSRTITTAVNDLYRATQHVQAGDLTYRVHVRHHDQLGALGEAFNSMTHSVATLIEEQRQRQRLENEISIAREVQAQLFPRELPKLPGVELEAICRAARMVSGDYYDFIRLGHSRLAIALADISGKGISAALLMASLQAALRSEVLRNAPGRSDGGGRLPNTADVVRHLNRHLFRSTSSERYATLFFAVYDGESRCLHYTNAGHLPPLVITDSGVSKLEAGGMVVGLFHDVAYEQATAEIGAGGTLIAYSDGLIEPENVFGEEFGAARLLDVALRQRDASPHHMAEAMMSAAEEWAGSPEQADDMTVVIARFAGPAKEARK